MIAQQKALTGHRVLVVEDEYFLADDLRRSLDGIGAEVLGPVASVEDALALITQNPQIDAAVLDINLRDVMSFPVADALVARNVPFIFATGYEQSVIPDRYAGIRRWEKPIAPDAIVEALLA